MIITMIKGLFNIRYIRQDLDNGFFSLKMSTSQALRH